MIRPFAGKMPRVAGSAFVSEAAYVVGDVAIGENSSVWPGAVVRADFGPVTVGRNTQIEDNSVVHCGEALKIGDNVHIGHGVVAHCRSIGDNVLVGNGAVLLDGAEVGDWSVIAAGSVVPRGARIPQRSFVAGVPAEVKGEPSQAHLDLLEQGVRVYCDLARRYKEQGL